MRRVIQYTLFITALVLIAAVVFGASITFVSMPQTPADALENTQGRCAGPLDWSYVLDHETYHCTYDPQITDRMFEESMCRDTMRYSTFFDPVSMHMVDPNDRCVGEIADMICGLTDDDEDRAVIALNFVQTAIGYEYDWDNYGCKSFAAAPLETLYLGKGDCEDTSILLMSIYLAMGYDCEMIDYPEHVAVGVRWEKGMEYRYCETVYDSPSPVLFDLSRYMDGSHEYPMGSIPDACIRINDGIGWYRNVIKRITGL